MIRDTIFSVVRAYPVGIKLCKFFHKYYGVYPIILDFLFDLAIAVRIICWHNYLILIEIKFPPIIFNWICMVFAF